MKYIQYLYVCLCLLVITSCDHHRLPNLKSHKSIISHVEIPHKRKVIKAVPYGDNQYMYYHDDTWFYFWLMTNNNNGSTYVTNIQSSTSSPSVQNVFTNRTPVEVVVNDKDEIVSGATAAPPGQIETEDDNAIEAAEAENAEIDASNAVAEAENASIDAENTAAIEAFESEGGNLGPSNDTSSDTSSTGDSGGGDSSGGSDGG